MPARTTRIHLTVFLSDADTVQLKMEDMGFGEMFPASHKIWEEAFSLRKKMIRIRKGIGYEQSPFMPRKDGGSSIQLRQGPGPRLFRRGIMLFSKENAYLLDETIFTRGLSDWLYKECGLPDLGQKLNMLQKNKEKAGGLCNGDF